MPRPSGRLGMLLALALYFVVSPQMALATVRGKVIERSIDLMNGRLGNTLEKQEIQLQHPHEASEKPSKFDLDVGQYMETDDKSLFEIERGKVANLENGAKKVDSYDKKIATVATNISEKTSGQLSTDLLKYNNEINSIKCTKGIQTFLRKVSTDDKLQVTESIQIVKKKKVDSKDALKNLQNVNNTSLIDKIHRFARNHVVKIKLWNDSFSPRDSRTFFGTIFQGKSTFLTGFGLGFLAFGLKKMLLPIFIGAQIIKSILIALFLPSIIGSIGKIVGKGVTSFAQSSQNPPQSIEENYEFKENQGLYKDDYMMRQPLGTLPASAMYDENMLQTKMPEIASRYSFVDPRLTSMNTLTDRYYTRHMINPHTKRHDFKVFHEIPTSSLLLTNYDPFYSPLLSRLDAVFSRLGYISEGCREYVVCAMYRSPARYAPYSNLVSAQLSRELNELRKPSSDNPDVLRFFRYMKAAKDGQDGLRCESVYENCESARDDQTVRQNQAMLATYQDIDKLVHARKF